MRIQKYMAEPPGRATDISKHPCSAASKLLPTKEEKSTKQSVDAYVPVPGLAKLQPAGLGGAIGPPRFSVTAALAAGTAANVYKKLPLSSVLLGAASANSTFVTGCVSVQALDAVVATSPGEIVGGF
jgi:hypothetical protein